MTSNKLSRGKLYQEAEKQRITLRELMEIGSRVLNRPIKKADDLVEFESEVRKLIEYIKRGKR